MNYDVEIIQQSHSNFKIKCERGIAQEIYEHFEFEDPVAKFKPQFKAGFWDGKIRFFNGRDRTLPCGLRDRLYAFLNRNEYTYNRVDFPTIPFDEQEIREFVESLNLHAHGDRIGCRDHQFDGIFESIKRGRLILECPTSSGKSLIIYILLRYYIHKLDTKVLLLVPTVQLVKQMFNDFTDYSSHNGWDVEENCHRIFGGEDKNTDKGIVISTWQSIYKLDESYFRKFDVVVADEAHLAKGKSIRDIMSKSVNAKYRIGTTGTMLDNKLDSMAIEGAFGQTHIVTTTSKLMSEGHVAKLRVFCLFFQHPKEDCNLIYHKAKVAESSTVAYQGEIDFLVSNERRNKYIVKLAKSLEGNTLILYQLVKKHGKVLDLMFDYMVKDRPYYFIHGSVDSEERELMRKKVESENNAIILASYGTMSTGTSIRNIDNIIFASPYKSKVKVVQSIGRGLRMMGDKTECKLFDLGDDLTHKKTKNKTLEHAMERINIYCQQEYDYKIVTIPLGV